MSSILDDIGMALFIFVAFIVELLILLVGAVIAIVGLVVLVASIKTPTWIGILIGVVALAVGFAIARAAFEREED